MSAVLILLAFEAVLAGAALAAARGRRLPAALYLLAITAPLEVYRSSVGSFNVSLFRISLGVAVVALAVARLRERSWGVVDPALPGAYLGLAALTGLALVSHPVNTFLGIKLIATAMVGAVAIVVVALLVTRASLEELGRALLFASILPILAASWQAIAPRVGADPTLPLVRHLVIAEGLDVNATAPAVIEGLTSRTKGTFGDPNHYGVFLMVVLVVGVALVLVAVHRRDRIQAASTGAACTALALSLLSTNSRTAWLATAVALGALGVLMRRLSDVRLINRRRRIGLAIAAVLAVGVLVPVTPNIRERLSPSAAVNKGSNNIHESTARAALEAFSSSPVVGAGPGGLGAALDQGQRTSGAHSTYLTFAAELGILGLIAVLWAAALTLRRLLRLCQREGPVRARFVATGFAAAYGGFLIANLTYDLWYDDVHWLLVGAASSLLLERSARASDRATAAPA